MCIQIELAEWHNRIKQLLDNSETKLKTKIYKTDFWIPIKPLSFNTGTMGAANQTLDCLFPAHTHTHFNTTVFCLSHTTHTMSGRCASAQRMLAHAFACTRLYASTSSFLTGSTSGSVLHSSIFIALWKPLADLTVLFQHCCGHTSHLV